MTVDEALAWAACVSDDPASDLERCAKTLAAAMRKEKKA